MINVLQVNLCQKLFFLQNMGRTWCVKNCSECQKQFSYTTCSPQVWAWNFHVLNLYSMNNLLSYCWLVDAKIRASDKDLPLDLKERKKYSYLKKPVQMKLPVFFLCHLKMTIINWWSTQFVTYVYLQLKSKEKGWCRVRSGISAIYLPTTWQMRTI